MAIMLEPVMWVVPLVFVGIPMPIAVLWLKLNKRSYLKWRDAISLPKINWEEELRSKPSPLKAFVVIYNLFFAIPLLIVWAWYGTQWDMFYLFWGKVLSGSFLLLYVPYQRKIYRKYKSSHW